MDVKPLFSYRPGKSAFHAMPAVLKVPLLFLLPATVFFLPLFYCLAWIACNAAAGFYAGFGLRRQLHDLKPVFYYGVLLAFVQLASFVFGGETSVKPLVELLIKLICAVQITALFFSTTTQLELKQALETILPAKAALLFTLFLMFIPLLFSVWAQLELSWEARAGKNSPKKIFVLLPVFISCALFKARSVFYAIGSRS